MPQLSLRLEDAVFAPSRVFYLGRRWLIGPLPEPCAFAANFAPLRYRLHHGSPPWVCRTRYDRSNLRKPGSPRMSGRTGHRFLAMENGGSMGRDAGGVGQVCLSPLRDGLPLRGLRAVFIPASASPRDGLPRCGLRAVLSGFGQRLKHQAFESSSGLTRDSITPMRRYEMGCTVKPCNDSNLDGTEVRFWSGGDITDLC